MITFPQADAAAGFVEKSVVVCEAKFFTGVRGEESEQRRVNIVNAEIGFLVGRSHFIGAEQETIRVAIDEVRGDLRGFGGGDDVLGDFGPRNIEIEIVESGVAEEGVQDGGMRFDGADDATEAGMGPDDGGFGMALDESFHLGKVEGLGAGSIGGNIGLVFGEGRIDVVVDDDDETGIGGKIEDAVESGILKAGDIAGNFRGDKFLVNGEFTDTGKDAGKGLQDAANVVGGVHIGGIKTGNHGIETSLLFFSERFVGHGDVGVGEGVVVEGSVAAEVVGGSVVAIDAKGPLLLQGNSEEGEAADAVTHEGQELVDVDAFLDVVGEMEVGIVELVFVLSENRRLGKEEGEKGERRGEKRGTQQKTAEAPEGHARAFRREWSRR